MPQRPPSGRTSAGRPGGGTRALAEGRRRWRESSRKRPAVASSRGGCAGRSPQRVAQHPDCGFGIRRRAGISPAKCRQTALKFAGRVAGTVRAGGGGARGRDAARNAGRVCRRAGKKPAAFRGAWLGGVPHWLPGYRAAGRATLSRGMNIAPAPLRWIRTSVARVMERETCSGCVCRDCIAGWTDSLARDMVRCRDGAKRRWFRWAAARSAGRVDSRTRATDSALLADGASWPFRPSAPFGRQALGLQNAAPRRQRQGRGRPSRGRVRPLDGRRTGSCAEANLSPERFGWRTAID